MQHGGSRIGAGRKKKSATEKLLEGNPGKRPIEIVNFEGSSELPKIPPDWLSARACKIYTSVWEWLEKVGCLKGILPAHLEEYASCKARWHQCEEHHERVGLIVKDAKGNPVHSPYVSLGNNFLRQANDAWAKIYAVVRESKLQEWDTKSPNDDVMERLLSRRP